MQRPPQNRLVAIPGYRPNLSRNESRNHGRELSSVPTTNNEKEKEKEKEELFGLGWTENSHSASDVTYNPAIKVEDKDNSVIKKKSEQQPIICLIDNTELNKIVFSNTIPDGIGIKTGIRKINIPPPYYDQGQLGSCTANAIGFIYQYELLKKQFNFGKNADGKLKSTAPSRLFIYYYERFLEKKEKEKDSGAKLFDGIEVLKTYGVCSEDDWAYYPDDIKKVIEPPIEVRQLAAEHKIMKDAGIKQTIFHALHIIDVKHILENGDPVAFGFTMYLNFQPHFTKLKIELTESLKEGKGPLSKEKYVMPKPNDKKEGGHAVVMVGFDDEIDDGSGGKGAFIIRNSWGEDWGMKGHFYMPYSFIFEKDNNGDYLGKVSNTISSGEFWAITDIPPPPPL